MDGRSGTAGAGWNEKIADGREDTDEPLQVPGQPEALHHSLSSTERQMRILRPIVEPLVRAVFDGRHNLALGGRVGTSLSVIMRRGGQPCLRKRRLSKRLAALVLRRL